MGGYITGSSIYSTGDSAVTTATTGVTQGWGVDLNNSALTDHAYHWLCYCSLVSQARPTTPSMDRLQYAFPCTILKVIHAVVDRV